MAECEAITEYLQLSNKKMLITKSYLHKSSIWSILALGLGLRLDRSVGMPAGRSFLVEAIGDSIFLLDSCKYSVIASHSANNFVSGFIQFQLQHFFDKNDVLLNAHIPTD